MQQRTAGHATSVPGQGAKKAPVHHSNCMRITRGVTCLPSRQPWALSEQGSLYYYKTTLSGISSLPLSELTKTTYILSLKKKIS